MGPCSIEVSCVGLQDPMQLLLMLDEQVIKALTPHAVHSRRWLVERGLGSVGA